MKAKKEKDQNQNPHSFSGGGPFPVNDFASAFSLAAPTKNSGRESAWVRIVTTVGPSQEKRERPQGLLSAT